MSFPRYPKYRDSGIEWLGEVPEHWRVVPLGRISVARCDGPFGSGLKSEHYTDTGVRVIRLQNIRREGFSDEDVAFIDASYYQSELAGHDVIGGDVLVAGLGDDRNTVGRACVAPTGIEPAMVKADCFRYRLDTAKAVPEFVATALSSCAAADAGLLSSGSTRSRIPLSAMLTRKIPIPPLGEQQVITEFIRAESLRLDALVAEQRRLMGLLKEKRQAVISHAVTKGLYPRAVMKPTGIEWLGDVPAHWEVTRLRRIVKSGTTITYGIVQAGPDIEGGIPYIRTSDMAGNSFPESGYMCTTREIDDSYARSKVRQNDLVVAIRASLGKGLLVPDFLEGANLTQGTARISPCERIIPRFLMWSFNSNYCQTSIEVVAKGTTFLEITLDALRRIPLVVPPVPEQIAIVTYLDQETRQLDVLTAEAQRAIDLLQERRTALISAAVTGQINARGSV